ncbi:MAG: hypothetical protein ACJA2K_002079, partial [Thalassolituus sp.]
MLGGLNQRLLVKLRAALLITVLSFLSSVLYADQNVIGNIAENVDENRSTLTNGDSAELVITLWQRNFDTAPVNEILELAFKKTEDLYPPVRLQRSTPMEYPDAISSIANRGAIDVISAASSKTNDSELYPIAFPVLKGLLGHRVCLIRKGEQARFDGLMTGYDFTEQKINICQGEYWPDTEVLQRNGLPVVTSKAYLPIFDMLQEGECDCFLRGAQEIIPEYQSRKAQVDIEQSFLVQYPQPGFFYVNRDNKLLAMRIELGLLRALDDGSYEELFNKLMSPQLDQLNLK